MIVLVSSFLIYVNLCAREDARARVFRTSAAPLQLKPIIQIVYQCEIKFVLYQSCVIV